MSVLTVLVAPSIWLAGLATGAAPPVESPRLVLQPCTLPDLEGAARCGTYNVFENRAAKAGRSIALKVVVLPATGTPRAADPFVFLEGGPGESATANAADLASQFAAIRVHRDLVLVDLRGTGGSHPLACDLYGPSDSIEGYLHDYFPVAAVRACRSQLERGADLTQYTLPIAVDDLDDVRRALGYEQLNLSGASYGTRTALVYLRRHPTHVRTITLQGVVPTNYFAPLWFPRNAQRALDGVLGECEADSACHAAFPDLRADVQTAFQRVVDHPAEVEIMHPTTGEPTRIVLSHDLLAETVRYMLYSPGLAAQVPVLLHAAAHDNLTPIAEAALFGRRQASRSISLGFYLSVTCTEDVPWIAPGEGERAAAGTFLGDYRLRQQRAACAAWPRGNLPAQYAAPVHSNVPALILSGEWDPVTPPQNGTDAAAELPRSLSLVVPHGGHDFDALLGLACLDTLATRFVEQGSATGLDTVCVRGIRRPPFPTTAPEVRIIRLSSDALQPYVGAYSGVSDPTRVHTEISHGKLAIVLPGERRFLLAPVSTTRFRVVGVPSAYVVFELRDGRVVQTGLEQGGVRTLTLVPAPH